MSPWPACGTTAAAVLPRSRGDDRLGQSRVLRFGLKTAALKSALNLPWQLDAPRRPLGYRP